MMTLEVVKQHKPTHHSIPDRYIILRDNDTHLDILDRETNQECTRTAEEIMLSGEYLFYSKADAVKIGFIWGKSRQ